MKKTGLLLGLFLSLEISLYAQTYYINGTTDASSGNQALIHNNELKIGNSTSVTERTKNMIKIGDGSYIQIGEWEADNLLSFKASKYNFTNGNVGIGVTSPQYKLDVAGNLNSTKIQTSYFTQRLNDNFTYDGQTMGHYALKWTDDSWQANCASLWLSGYGGMKFFTGGDPNPRFVVARNGNVGLGTVSPGAILEINHDGEPLENEHVVHGFRIKGTDQTLIMGVKSSTHVSYIQSIDYGTISAPLLLNARGGNVGIGTTDPQNKLDVKGVIRATEVKIETGWADFVFNDEYRLRPLSEVNSFIKENKHLPEIPSATEIEKNEGVNLGEMQVKLLQKIEELTLYLIRQENTIQELRDKIEKLEEKEN